MKIKTWAILLGVFSIVTLFGVMGIKNKEPKKVLSSNCLKVGTNAEFAPFAFIEHKEVKGFDIDLAKEIGKRLNREVEIVDMSWDALIPDLKSHKIDFVASGMTITEERKKVVQFTKPYLDGEPLVACFFSNQYQADTLEAALESKLIVNDGYTADFYVTDQLHKKPLRVQSPLDAIESLRSGRADTYILAKSTLASFTKEKKNSQLNHIVLEGTSENCAILVAKESNELLESINQVLDELKAEGFIESLKEKWGL